MSLLNHVLRAYSIHNDKITDIKVDAEFETVDIGATAAESLAEVILAKGDLDVDIVAGATATTNAMMTACRQALAMIANP